MSVEYAARMEILQRKREELTAQRQAIEKRMALREATAAEFSAVALQSYKQKWKAQRSAAVAAKKRNDELTRSLYETQMQVHDTWSRLQSDQSSSSVLVAQEKARYNRRVEQIYPAWQEQLQRQRVQRLRELEDKKRAVERRRYLAKKSFEKEQTLDGLIRKTRHEVEMAENLEQNELYERELLRTQNTNQANEVDQSIREVASEARGYLQQQAAKHLEVMPELDDELAEKLSETFSPRNALRALREGSSSFAFEENLQYEEEKPARQIRVEIPTRMNTPTRSYYPEVRQRRPNQAYSADETFEGDFIDEVPREFNERSALFNSTTMAERYQANTNAGNDYTDFKQNINRNQPAVMPRDQSRVAPGNLASTPGGAISQTATYSEMEQLRAAPPIVLIRNEAREEMLNQPGKRLEELPTLVTGSLYPIPEANEPISSSGTSPMIPGKVNVRGSNINCERENGSAGANTSSLVISATAAGSRANPSDPPTSTPPAKIATSPAAPVTVVTSVSGTLYSRVQVDRPVENQGNAIAPEAFVKETNIPELPASSIPESFVSRPSVIERSVEGSDELPWHEVNDELRSKEATPPDEKSTVSEGGDFSLSVDSISSPSQPDPTNNTSIPGVAVESLLDTKEIVADEITANKNIVGIEVVPRTTFKKDTVDAEQSLSQDSEIGNFALDRMDANLSTTSTSASDAVKAPVETVQENDIEAASTEVPESPPSPISYSMDLLEPFTPPASKRINALMAEDDMLLTSMQSDDFDLSASSIQPAVETKQTVSSANDTIMKNDVAAVVENHARPTEPTSPAAEEISTASITEKLSPVDRVKALGALISRVEEGATEGDTLGRPTDTGSSNESKRELLKMAVGGRKAQIAFFGSDICFELILDISRDVGPVLFPSKAFEGIMNDQKIRKLHQSSKEKQLDLWKALSAHLKQLVQLKAIPSATLVDLFVAAFLAHDPGNQRSQRKLREFLVTVCGGGGSSKTPSPRKETSTTSPPKQDQRAPSPEFAKPVETEDRVGTPQLLQTAFLQRQSPPKPKVFGIASSSFKDRSSGSSDVLMSMSSGPMKLSQKLMRGGKMNDYSEFEEEEEVDLQNLIGSKPTFGASSSALGRSYQAPKSYTTGKSAAKQAAVEEEEDEFDADF